MHGIRHAAEIGALNPTNVDGPNSEGPTETDIGTRPRFERNPSVEHAIFPFVGPVDIRYLCVGARGEHRSCRLSGLAARELEFASLTLDKQGEMRRLDRKRRRGSENRNIFQRITPIGQRNPRPAFRWKAPTYY